jgi:ATP/maltotriose-dependent transcriptional regulator MalT/DNA-binding SARP family transcriptional activator
VSRDRLAGQVWDALETGALVLTAGAGSGKTTILEQALARHATAAAWVSCSEAERVPGSLLMRIVEAIAKAVPGASAAVAERLANAPQSVDALAATRELSAELSRLLVEPLVLVIDDAEHLDGAGESLRLLVELMKDGDPLHVAIASRRPLDLHVAKLRADGRLADMTASDLAFDAQACATLLRSRGGPEPSLEQVEDMMQATEGWPLGIALAARLLERESGAALTDLASAPDLHSYLSEELLDSLDAELREAVIESSVARAVTPEVARALKLPDDFERRIERAGVLMRHLDHHEGAFTYHPLLREFLLRRLRDERGEEGWRALNATVAPAVAASGDAVGAIEHWLEAQRWPDAVAAIELQGFNRTRTSPELMRRWLSRLPADVRELPTLRALEGQLDWLAGDNLKAIPALREAIRGFREAPNPLAEWAARSILVDGLFAVGEIDEVEGAVEGWDVPAAAPAGGLPPAAVMLAATVLASFGRFEDSDRLAAAAKRHPVPDLVAPFDALRVAFRDLPQGRLDEACEALRLAMRELDPRNPLNGRHHVAGVLAIALANRGDLDAALREWIDIGESVRGGEAPLLADAVLGWCAMLHAQAGRLTEAEAFLAQYRRVETGTRAFISGLAPATVASLRGDVAATVAGADLTLELVGPGATMLRYWAGADLVAPLAAVGRLDRAREVLDDTLALVDEHYPGPLGCFPRGRLLVLRAWLRHTEGEPALADADLQAAWTEAGESLRFILRREWNRLEPAVWGALERGALEPEPTVETVATAFPEGLELVSFLEHPLAAVRRAAIAPAVASGDPRALECLKRLEGDPDADLARAATRASEQLATALPPYRFELLGHFAVRRRSWAVEERDWGRPVDARLVRFLLVHLEGPVPEDEFLEALWPDLSQSSARRSLHVAVSRARGVLDPPGAGHSAIDYADRCYRLALGERDVVDAEEFRSAAESALADGGEEQRALLERARSLWGGEPLPQERYADWATAYRERLIDRYIAVLTALVDLHVHGGDHASAVDVARELVTLDPLNEGGHRALIVAYARTGRRGHALRQYLECRRVLVEELGVEPAEETSRLQARVLAGDRV